MKTNKKIVVSVHDITPRFHNECVEIFKKLDELGVNQRSLLITPEFAGKFLIDENEEFIAMMNNEKQNGAELALHGLIHQNFEFYKKNYDEAKSALQRGMDIFEKAFGYVPRGFVAPQWFQSKGSLQAIQELGFLYTAVFRSLRYSDGKEFKTLPLNFDWGNSVLDKIITAVNKFAVSFRKTGLIRFAVHPMDIPNGVFDEEMKILARILDDGWEPVSYENLPGKEIY